MPPQPTQKAQPQKQAPQNPQGANKAQANPPQGQAAAAQQNPKELFKVLTKGLLQKIWRLKQAK